MKKLLANLAETAFFAVIDGMTFVGESLLGIVSSALSCGLRRRRNE